MLRMTPLGTRALGGWKDMTPVRDEVLIGRPVDLDINGTSLPLLIRPQDARADDSDSPTAIQDATPAL